MKFFLSVIAIIFIFQTLSKSDDLKDFAIEGISLGDSLLDHFNKEIIESEKYNINSLMYKNNKFVQIGASHKKSYQLNVNSKTYDDLSIVLKTNDETYRIYSLAGRIFCKDIDACKIQKADIEKDLKNLFGENAKVVYQNINHSYDPTGNSKSYSTFFTFNNIKDYAFVAVYDWSTEMENKHEWKDSLKVTLISGEFSDFLNNVQYKN